jgi:hypothetical protein
MSGNHQKLDLQITMKNHPLRCLASTHMKTGVSAETPKRTAELWNAQIKVHPSHDREEHIRGFGKASAQKVRHRCLAVKTKATSKEELH